MGLTSSRYEPPPQQNTQLLDLICEIKDLKKQIESLHP